VPPGLKQFKLIDSDGFVSGVLPAVSGHSIPYSPSQALEIEADRQSFTGTVQAIVTTVSAPGGSQSFSVLRNRYGMYVATDLDYAEIVGNYSGSKQTHAFSPELWPPLTKLATTTLTNRVVGATSSAPPRLLMSKLGVRPTFTRLPEKAEAGAAAAVLGGIGGAAQGIGAYFTNLQQQGFSREMLQMKIDRDYKIQQQQFQQQKEMLLLAQGQQATAAILRGRPATGAFTMVGDIRLPIRRPPAPSSTTTLPDYDFDDSASSYGSNTSLVKDIRGFMRDNDIQSLSSTSTTPSSSFPGDHTENPFAAAPSSSGGSLHSENVEMHTFPSDKQPLLQVTQGDTKV
jgi:hypothetical protein